MDTRRYITLCENVMMVGYTFDDYAWCDMADKSEVYDRYGNKIATVTGDFYNAFDYAGGLVYYTEKSGALYRAKPDREPKKCSLQRRHTIPNIRTGSFITLTTPGISAA